MLYRILRKLSIAYLFLKILAPFIHGKRELPDLDAAFNGLSKLSPDPKGSCICAGRERKMSKDFDLDIIVPSYNSEKTIESCLHSVLEQKCSFRFRLIVIDDGATDRSPELIDKFSQDPRVLIIHQKNKGFSGARNAGLAVSDAKYIMFLDSDDSLCEGAIENLMQCIYCNGAAVAEGAFNAVSPNGKIRSTTSHKAGQLNPRNDMTGYVWGKIFEAELFNGICLPLDYWYEDSLIAQIIYPLIENRNKTAYGISEAVYNYTINPSGITATSRKNKKCVDSLWITLQLYKDRCTLGLEKDARYYEYILSMVRLTYLRCEALPEDAKKFIFVIWNNFINKEFQTFTTSNPKKEILQSAIRSGNYELYALACKLI